MLGGIIFQLGMSTSLPFFTLSKSSFHLAVIVVFSICAIEFMIRYTRQAPVREDGVNARGEMTKKLRLMGCGLAFITLVLFIR